MSKSDAVEKIIRKTLDSSARMMAIMPHLAEAYNDIASELEYIGYFLRPGTCVFEAEKDILLYRVSTGKDYYTLSFIVIDAGTEFTMSMHYYGEAHIERIYLPLSSPSILQLKYCRQKSLECLSGVDHSNLEEPFIRQIARNYRREKIVRLVDKYSNTYRTENIFPEARNIEKEKLLKMIDEKADLTYSYGIEMYEKYIAGNMPDMRRQIAFNEKIITSYMTPRIGRVELFFTSEIESSRDFDKYVSALNFIPGDIVHILELLE